MVIWSPCYIRKPWILEFHQKSITFKLKNWFSSHRDIFWKYGGKIAKYFLQQKFTLGWNCIATTNVWVSASFRFVDCVARYENVTPWRFVSEVKIFKILLKANHIPGGLNKIVSDDGISPRITEGRKFWAYLSKNNLPVSHRDIQYRLEDRWQVIMLCFIKYNSSVSLKLH